MDPLETLTQEHRTIERVLAALEVHAAFLQAGGAAPRDEVGRFARFLAEYADRLHHGKEEDLLFARLTDIGFARHEGPVGVMLFEHAKGRELVATLRRLALIPGEWTPADRQAAAAAATAYASLLRSHIEREDRILYPMAVQHLSRETLEELGRDFAHQRAAHAEVEQELAALAAQLEAHWTFGRGEAAAPVEPTPGCGCLPRDGHAGRPD
jgi:hemerythrin-like domain-containing protein